MRKRKGRKTTETECRHGVALSAPRCGTCEYEASVAGIPRSHEVRMLQRPVEVDK